MRSVVVRAERPDLPTAEAVVSARDVVRTYGDGDAAVHALRGVSLDIAKGGLTAVMGAANRGSDDIVQFLVDKGARLDVKDKEGRTPLTWAEGVFLATHPARPKPTSIALIKKLAGAGSGAGR